MFASKQQLLTAAIVSSIILSVAVFAGSAAGVGTTVEGPDEVTKPDRFTVTSTVDFEDGEQVSVESYTLTLRPAGADDETANLTFAPDGEVLGTEPARGVVGQGEIRVTQLRKTAEVTPVDGNGSYGYTAGYGDNQTTVTYDIELNSTAFKQGDYEVFLTVNTKNETGLYRSNVNSFTVQTSDEDETEEERDEDESDETESEENESEGSGDGASEAIDGLDVDPDVLDESPNAKWLNGYVELPDHAVSEINISTVEANGIPAVDDPEYGFVSDPEIKDRDGDGSPELLVKFTRSGVVETLEPGEKATITVNGTVSDGSFSVTDTVRVRSDDGSNGHGRGR